MGPANANAQQLQPTQQHPAMLPNSPLPMQYGAQAQPCLFSGQQPQAQQMAFAGQQPFLYTGQQQPHTPPMYPQPSFNSPYQSDFGSSSTMATTPTEPAGGKDTCTPKLNLLKGFHLNI